MNSYDKKFCWLWQIRVADEVYMECPQYATFASHPAEEFAQKKYNKLMRRMWVPFKVDEAQCHTDGIDENGILNRPDMVTPVHILSKEEKQTTKTNHGSLFEEASTPAHSTKTPNEAKTNKYCLRVHGKPHLSSYEKYGTDALRDVLVRVRPARRHSETTCTRTSKIHQSILEKQAKVT